MAESKKDKKADAAKPARPITKSYMQNRELSWLDFNKRVLDQSQDPNVPLLERLKFLAIWRSNLQEFFMVRVGSLLDLELAKETLYDSKTGMTPSEQLTAVYSRVAQLTPVASNDFITLRHTLEAQGIHQLYPDELTPAQKTQLMKYLDANVVPLLSPQIINSLHPFPHLENGALYIMVRLDDQAELGKMSKKSTTKDQRRQAKAKAAENVIMGIIPLPHNCPRIIKLDSPAEGGFSFILMEHALEMVTDEIFSMYPVKFTNVIQVTRNADLDMHEETDEADEDFRAHMKRILKKRGRLEPVRLESERPLSDTTQRFLCSKLGLKNHQVYSAGLPLDLSYAFALPGMLPASLAAQFTDEPATPQWPAELVRGRSIIAQVQEKDVLLSYPYETMDAFVHLLQEAAVDPDVISIKITLYRLASQSRLAEALITAAENGKEVTALFELRARFDESNNIEWSQRFEQAGCTIIYGFHDYKVHSKICAITRRTPEGLQFITQLGTGNYNEKTAKLYTDFSMITCNPDIGMDASKFFRNMQLEAVSDDYRVMKVAPLMIKQGLADMIDAEIAKAREGKPCGIVLKTNSVTDRATIEKIAEASRAGVPITMLVRGISCLVPGIPGDTDNVRIVSVVGRLLEHSRIYVFGAEGSQSVWLSSADLMTRNLDKRVEIAWPVLDASCKAKVLSYLDVMLRDTAKLRELQANGAYTELGCFVQPGKRPFDAQDHLIKEAYIAAENAPSAQRTVAMHAVSTQIEAMQEEAELTYTREVARDVRLADSELEVVDEGGYAGKNEGGMPDEGVVVVPVAVEPEPEAEVEPTVAAEPEADVEPEDSTEAVVAPAVEPATAAEPDSTSYDDSPAALADQAAALLAAVCPSAANLAAVANEAAAIFGEDEAPADEPAAYQPEEPTETIEAEPAETEPAYETDVSAELMTNDNAAATPPDVTAKIPVVQPEPVAISAEETAEIPVVVAHEASLEPTFDQALEPADGIFDDEQSAETETLAAAPQETQEAPALQLNEDDSAANEPVQSAPEEPATAETPAQMPAIELVDEAPVQPASEEPAQPAEAPATTAEPEPLEATPAAPAAPAPEPVGSPEPAPAAPAPEAPEAEPAPETPALLDRKPEPFAMPKRKNIFARIFGLK